MNDDAVSKLVEKAVKMYMAGMQEKAEALLVDALAKNDHPNMRTNLAKLRLMSGDMEGVLESLSSLLGQGNFQAEMAAVPALLVLGRKKEAEESLKQMEHIIQNLLVSKGKELDEKEQGYFEVLLQLEGNVGYHRRVLEHYKRWKRYDSHGELRYYAAVASFNLGRFKQAASHWSALGKFPLAMEMQYVAVLVERGVVPPFELEFALPLAEVINKLMGEARSMVDEVGIQSGLIRMITLAMALHEDATEDQVIEVLEPLIHPTDPWSSALAEGLIESSVIPRHVKIAVLKLMVDIGKLPEGEPIPLIINGELEHIKITLVDEPEDDEIDLISGNMLKMMVGRHKEELREAVERKTLPLNSGLGRGLKNMPAEWLDAICLHFGLKLARLRKEREKQLVDFLTTPIGIYRAVESMEQDEKELLGYLLDKGGWVNLGSVTRKFGSMAGDGYFWLEEEAISSLGRLWRTALVMVGTTIINGRKARYVSVPIDLRRGVQAALDGFMPEDLPVERVARQDPEDTEIALDVDMVFQLNITLEDVYPPVWRRVLVPTSITFWELHVVIQDVMGWDDCHLHMFLVKSMKSQMIKIGIPQDDLFNQGGSVLHGWEQRVADYLTPKKKKIRYVYDFGDDWAHLITLEKLIEAEEDGHYPRCIAGEYACPPEDSGGVHGYKMLRMRGEIDSGTFDCSDVEFSDAEKRLRKIKKQLNLI